MLKNSFSLKERECGCNNSQVGKCFTWASFTSVSESRNIAVEFANGEYYHEGHGRPILFEISTFSRGAPLLGWSKYPNEDEILLRPFQGFEVVDQFVSHGMLVVQLKTVRLESQIVPRQDYAPAQVVTHTYVVDEKAHNHHRVLHWGGYCVA